MTKTTYLYYFNRLSFGQSTCLILAYYPIINRQFNDLIKWELREALFGHDDHINISLGWLFIPVQPSINFKILACYVLIALIIAKAVNIVTVIIHYNFFNYYAVTIPVDDFQCADFSFPISLNNEVWRSIPNNEICLTFLFGYLFAQFCDSQSGSDKRTYGCSPSAERAYPAAEAESTAFMRFACIDTYDSKIEKPKSYKYTQTGSANNCYKDAFFIQKHHHSPAKSEELSSTITNGLARAAA